MSIKTFTRWTLGLLIMVLGVLALSTSVIASILFILVSLLLIPISFEFIKQRINISKTIRNVIILCITPLALFLYGKALIKEVDDAFKIMNEKVAEQSFLTFRDVSKELIEIDIDTMVNFNTLINVAEKINCDDKIAVVKIETQKNIYKVQPLTFCGEIFDYKLREIIYVNLDSITVNYKLNYPIDSLKIVLNKHLKNPQNDNNYPLSNEKRLISIDVDGKRDIKETKKILLKIISCINEINSKKHLSFMFQKGGIIREVE